MQGLNRATAARQLRSNGCKSIPKHESSCFQACSKDLGTRVSVISGPGAADPPHRTGESEMGTRQMVTRTAGLVLMLGVLLGAGSWLQASEQSVGHAQRFNCTNATLRGNYAIIGGGFVPGGAPPAPLVPFANVSLMTLDGAGNFSDRITFSANGQIVQTVQFGTYTVNADCTGKMIRFLPEPPFQLAFDLVVSAAHGGDEGTEFYSIGTTPGGVNTSTAKRISMNVD
jgi:hypothetical protein